MKKSKVIYLKNPAQSDISYEVQSREEEGYKLVDTKITSSYTGSFSSTLHLVLVFEKEVESARRN